LLDDAKEWNSELENTISDMQSTIVCIEDTILHQCGVIMSLNDILQASQPTANSLLLSELKDSAPLSH
jgi:hypothetical protein